MSWSSLATKNNITPMKNISDMTEKDWFEFRNNLNSDEMGFDDVEGYPEEEHVDVNTMPKVSGESIGNLFINNNLTTRNYTNGYSTSRIKYIVIHYTANNGDTAKGNTNYFKSTYRGASAHYFVDENSIWRCVEDKNIAWHCGGGLQGSNGHAYYQICKNSNSIGIEMCSRISNGSYYFKNETVDNCIALTKYLMNKYNVPVSNVIRHYDVTGKICPEPYIRSINLWNSFKDRLISNNIQKHWASQYLDILVSKKMITDIDFWDKYDEPLTKAYTVALLDKVSGGLWPSEEDDTSIHWAQPNVISLCGKQILSDYKQWISTLNNNISKALTLALVDKMTNGMLAPYNTRNDVDHWARNCLDSLCDKGIVKTPSAWTDFDSEVNKGLFMALICEAVYK